MSQSTIMLSLILVFLVMIRPCSSEKSSIQKTRYGFGGKPMSKNEYQWHGAILLEDSTFVCSGSLIGSRFVVTSRHCIKEDERNSIKVEIGYLCRRRDNCNRDSEMIDVEKIYRHEEGGDMALIVLKRRININVTPAVPYLGPLVTQDVKPLSRGRQMKLVGVGRKGRGGKFAPRARKLTVRSISRQQCSKRLKKNRDRVTEFTTCSIAMDGNTCGVDAGGAVTVPGRGKWRGRDVIMAIHSFGYRNCWSSSSGLQHAMGHFLLSNGANLLEEVVCSGAYGPPEDWCNGSFEPTTTPTFEPTLAPTPEPRVEELLFLGELTGVHGLYASSVEFNEDGSRLVSGGGRDYYASIALWDPKKIGEAALATGKAEASIRSVSWNPGDGSMIASLAANSEIKVWKSKNDALSLMMTLQDATFCREGWRSIVVWHPTRANTLLANTCKDGNVGVWAVGQKTAEKMDTISTGQGDGAVVLAFHPDGTVLATSGSDGTIKLWRGDSFELVETISVPAAKDVYSLAFSPNGKYLAAADFSNSVHTWNVATGEKIYTIGASPLRCRVVTWSPDGRYLLVGGYTFYTGYDGKLAIYDGVKGGRELKFWDAADGRSTSVGCVAWSPDGGTIVAGLTNGDIQMWSVATS